MQSASLPNDALADFYRFAVLLTGGIASGERLMADTLAENAPALAQMRSDPNRRGWFASKLREKCPAVTDPPPEGPRLLREGNGTDHPFEVLEIEAYLVAQRFYQLPEPDRSALALFYLDLFTTDEIARLLKLEPDQLAEALRRGRDGLYSRLRGHPDQPTP